MNEKIRFSQRLAVAMKDSGYEPRPAVLEREFNLRYWGRSITLQAVRRWLCGESIPAQDKLLVLADWLGVDPHTLRYGEEASKKIAANKKLLDAALQGEEKEVLLAYLSLPAEKRKIIREVILAFAQGQ